MSRTHHQVFLIIFNIYSNKKIPLNQLDINQQNQQKALGR
jgi:hypothetical protein